MFGYQSRTNYRDLFLGQEVSIPQRFGFAAPQTVGQSARPKPYHPSAYLFLIRVNVEAAQSLQGRRENTWPRIMETAWIAKCETYAGTEPGGEEYICASLQHDASEIYSHGSEKIMGTKLQCKLGKLV